MVISWEIDLKVAKWKMDIHLLTALHILIQTISTGLMSKTGDYR